MVFSSLEFIYLFLFPTLLVFVFLRRLAWENGIIWWLIIASLIFYAWWSITYLVLLLISVVANFILHKLLLKQQSKLILTLGTIANLLTLAYFKYANFLIENFNTLSAQNIPLLNVILPLAISFFTFQQISFLFDTYHNKVSDCDFARYCLFVVFFPQLIAGPIVLQKHTLPQFKLSVFKNHAWINFAVGGSLFGIGLFKKIVFADAMAPMANQVFNTALTGQGVPMEAAWLGVFCYSLQIYFDFSGYCDMALGLARMFGIKLPINFNSPYQALSIVDFWRRWHITLSSFLRDYIYIPLGGSRYGKSRQYLSLMATMLLGGLWHGASWTFVFWGLLHGLYLAINHSWSALFDRLMNKHTNVWLKNMLPASLTRLLSHLLTMLAVMVAWVFFRAESFSAAQAILVGMFGLTEFYQINVWSPILINSTSLWLMISILLFIVGYCPNSIEIMKYYRPVLMTNKVMLPSLGLSKLIKQQFYWRPSTTWSMLLFSIITTSLLYLYNANNLTEFIYFNF